MSDSFVPTSPSPNAEKLQTYKNVVAGVEVHSEAVTPTDEFGQPYDAGNRFQVEDKNSDAVAASLATLLAHTDQLEPHLLKILFQLIHGAGTRHVKPQYSRDQYLYREILERQTRGTAGVLSFAFTAPVDIVYVFSKDFDGHDAYADPQGGTVADGVGIPIMPGVAQSFPVQTAAFSIWTVGGSEVTVWGFRY